MFTLHRPRKDETDFERLWLGLSAIALPTAAAWLYLGMHSPACLFHSITGIPCLTCGATRCVKSLVAGHFETALSWNPLALLTIAAAALCTIYTLVVVPLGLPRLRPAPLSPAGWNVLRVAVALVVTANWIYLVVRFSHGA